jgi:hypothetical protein
MQNAWSPVYTRDNKPSTNSNRDVHWKLCTEIHISLKTSSFSKTSIASSGFLNSLTYAIHYRHHHKIANQPTTITNNASTHSGSRRFWYYHRRTTTFFAALDTRYSGRYESSQPPASCCRCRCTHYPPRPAFIICEQKLLPCTAGQSTHFHLASIFDRLVLGSLGHLSRDCRLVIAYFATGTGPSTGPSAGPSQDLQWSSMTQSSMMQSYGTIVSSLQQRLSGAFQTLRPNLTLQEEGLYARLQHRPDMTDEERKRHILNYPSNYAPQPSIYWHSCNVHVLGVGLGLKELRLRLGVGI